MGASIDAIKGLASVANSMVDLDTKKKLLDAQAAALEVAAHNLELAQENERLKKQLLFRNEVRFERGVLWAEGDDNPFCNACWEGKQKAIHLREDQTAPEHYECPSCKERYSTKTPRQVSLSSVGTVPRDNQFDF